MSEKSKNLPITIVPKESIEDDEWIYKWNEEIENGWYVGDYATVKARYE